MQMIRHCFYLVLRPNHSVFVCGVAVFPFVSWTKQQLTNKYYFKKVYLRLSFSFICSLFCAVTRNFEANGLPEATAGLGRLFCSFGEARGFFCFVLKASNTFLKCAAILILQVDVKICARAI